MSQPSTKKRKPNPLQDSHAPSKKQLKQSKAGQDESFASDSSTLPPDDMPFTLECPVRQVAKKGKKKPVQDDVFGPKQEDGGFANLKIDYTIRPGKAWADMKIYRNFSSKLCCMPNSANVKRKN
jgi:hypothetical protein